MSTLFLEMAHAVYANTVYKATGQRIRALPFALHGLSAA